MAKEINISRPRLKEYIQQHIDVLAQTADISLNVHELEAMDGTKSFIATVNIEFNDIPVEAVEALNG